MATRPHCGFDNSMGVGLYASLAEGQSMVETKLDETLQSFRRAIEAQSSAQVIQIPLWQESKRGTPNSFIRSALFSAIQGEDRGSVANSG